jgi:hypothetical protein
MIGVSESIVRTYLRKNERNRLLFTKCFEEYINRLHNILGIKAVRENELKEFYRTHDKSGKQVVDFLITQDGSNLFIDAKGIDPTNPVLSAITRFVISQRIKGQHLKAIRQIIETIDVLSSHGYEDLVELDERFGLVVTHQDFFLGTGDRIFEHLNDTLRDDISELADGKILLSNIHFMSVEQYEKIICISTETATKTTDFFKYVNEQVNSPQSMRFIMDQYIEGYSQKIYGTINIPNGSPLLLQERDRLFDNALKLITDNSNFWTSVGKHGDSGVTSFLLKYNELVGLFFGESVSR